MEGKGKEASSPRNFIGTGKEGQRRSQRSIQTKIQSYPDSIRAGKSKAAIPSITALRKNLLLGGLGSMGSRGAQKSPGKPPSLSKVGRVSGGRRKVDGIGKCTSLERWLLSGGGRQEAGTEADPGRRKGGNKEEKALLQKERAVGEE